MSKKNNDYSLAIFFGVPGVLLIVVCIWGFLSTDSKKNERITTYLSENNFIEARKEVEKIQDEEIKEDARGKVSRAEITYYIKQNEFARAKAVATEDGQDSMYQQIIGEWMSQLITNQQYSEAANILQNWTFTYSAKFDAKNITQSAIDDVNKDYNHERNTYNDYVTKLINAAAFDDNVALVKKCLMLYRNIMIVETKKKIGNDYYDVTFKKDNTALREMKKKLALQHIKVD
ncbi:MAG: hypothetical protein J6W37_04700 [Bacteroidales bacterium]|nr:hypothetical protein [Bacteroidales bacterium]